MFVAQTCKSPSLPRPLAAFPSPWRRLSSDRGVRKTRRRVYRSNIRRDVIGMTRLRLLCAPSCLCRPHSLLPRVFPPFFFLSFQTSYIFMRVLCVDPSVRTSVSPSVRACERACLASTHAHAYADCVAVCLSVWGGRIYHRWGPCGHLISGDTRARASLSIALPDR